MLFWKSLIRWYHKYNGVLYDCTFLRWKIPLNSNKSPPQEEDGAASSISRTVGNGLINQGGLLLTRTNNGRFKRRIGILIRQLRNRDKWRVLDSWSWTIKGLQSPVITPALDVAIGGREEPYKCSESFDVRHPWNRPPSLLLVAAVQWSQGCYAVCILAE